MPSLPEKIDPAQLARLGSLPIKARVIVEGARCTLRAIARAEIPAARPRVMPSRSSAVRAVARRRRGGRTMPPSRAS